MNMVRRALAFAVGAFGAAVALPLLWAASVGNTPAAGNEGGGAESSGWVQSYQAGHRDAKGAWVGGSEIMHLVAHCGKLFAANGYWKDSHWERPASGEPQSAQVLRLDAANGAWQVDLDTGATNSTGARYMKGNILKSVTFTRDAQGGPLTPPRQLLVLAAGDIRSQVSAWVRDDVTDRWSHTLVKDGVPADGVRWVPRDMEVHRDRVTGLERLFLLLGNPGIISGVYDASRPSGIRWETEVEFPIGRPFATRPLGIAEISGRLVFSVGGVIYQREDGETPTYREILNLAGGVNTDVGGIRGLTAIANPNGPGESLLFVWVPNGRSAGQVKRLDPDGAGGYTVHDEASLRDLMAAALGGRVRSVLGGYNELREFVDPTTGETVQVIGFEGVLRENESLRWPGSAYYAGGLYAVRRADRTYTVHEIAGPYAPGRPILVAPRTFAASPFGDHMLYVGGHDANFRSSDNMAWIFRGPMAAALDPQGQRQARRGN